MRRVVTALLLCGIAALAAAQSYPSKPVKIIVPAAAGGGGIIACQTVARAAPDGYTLMVGYVATHGTNPAVRKVPYDPIKDFTPIAMVGGTQNVLVVGTHVPVDD